MNKSIETLKRFNAWRTGEDDRTMDEAGIVPSEVTAAINDVVSMHEEMIAIIECGVGLGLFTESYDSSVSHKCICKSVSAMMERTK
jgi:hypothetical protein